MSNELKPCPFCGWGTICEVSTVPFRHKCGCHACGASTASYRTWDEAVEAWNTRTPEQAIAATLGGGKPTTDVAEKVEELRAESLKFPPNIRRKVNVALDGIEQAIAATLGEQHGTAEIDELLDKFENECYMLRVEASETRAKDEAVREAYERIREESARAIAATLGTLNESTKALIDDMLYFIGNCCETTLDCDCCDLVDCKYLNGDGELAECTRYQDFLSRAKVIAATLGGGECEWELEHSGTLYDKWRCSECKFLFVEPRCDQGYTDLDPNFCPKCGMAVKR